MHQKLSSVLLTCVLVFNITFSAIPIALASEDDTVQSTPQQSNEEVVIPSEVQQDLDVITAEVNSETPTLDSTTEVATNHTEVSSRPAPAPKKSTPILNERLQSGGSSGALIYRYPITVPAGRNGTTPHLELTYNHQNPNPHTTVATGWSLSEYSIERFTRTGTQNLYSVNTFRITSPEGSAELVPIIINQNGFGTYGARYEDQFWKVEYFSDLSWKITNTQGKVYKFGDSISTRMVNPQNSGQIFRWVLTEERDLNDNFIRYEYLEDGRNLYLNRIYYTGHQQADGPFEIRLNYFGHSVKRSHYFGQYRIDIQKALDNIEVYTLGQRTKLYEVTQVLNSEQNYLLTQIQETGYLNNQTTQMPPTVFEYQASDTSWTDNGSVVVPIMAANGGTNNMVQPSYPARFFTDVNGDGYQDFVEMYTSVGSSGVSASLNSGGWQIPFQSQPAYQVSVTKIDFNVSANSMYGNPFRLADFNSDGLIDVIATGYNAPQGSSRLFLNDGNSWVPSQFISRAFNLASPIEQVDPAKSYFTDMNNDGLPDFVSISVRNKSGRSLQYMHISIDVFLGTGIGSWSSAAEPAYSVSYDSPNWNIEMGGGTGNLADANGDGLLDFFFKMSTFDGFSHPCSQYHNCGYFYFNTGAGFELDDSIQAVDIPNASSYGRYSGTESQFLDYNRDGVGDAVSLSHQGNGANGSINFYPSHFYYSSQNTTSSSQTHSYGQGGTLIQPLFPNWPTRPTSQITDLNGDGKSEFIVSADFGINNTQKNSYTYNYLPTFHLKKVTTPEGGESTIDYTTKTVNKMGGPIFVVNSVTHQNQYGSNVTQTYTYQDGFYSILSQNEKRFAGFGKVTSTDFEGNQTITYYHQDQNSVDHSSLGEFQDHESKLGKIFREEIHDNQLGKLTQSISKWKTVDLGNNRTWAKLSSQLIIAFEGQTTPKSKAITYLYDDSNGNLLEKTNMGEVNADNTGLYTDFGTDTLKTVITYASNSTLHILSQISNVTLQNYAGQKVWEEKYLYDYSRNVNEVTKGNKTQVEKWESVNDSYIAERISYNRFGLVENIRDSLNRAHQYGYDTTNTRPRVEVNRANFKTEWIYDLTSGQILEEKQPNGLILKFDYDGVGRLTQKWSSNAGPNGTPLTFQEITYNDQSSPHLQHFKDHFTSSVIRDTYQYTDGFGQPLQTRTESGISGQFSVTTRKYNNLGLVEKETLPSFKQGSAFSPFVITELGTAFTYDGLGRPLTATDTMGTVSTTYRPWRTTISNARQKTKDLFINAYDQLVQVSEHNEGLIYTTLYQYNDLGNLKQILDAENNVRNFTYNSLSQLTSMEDLHARSDTTFSVWSYIYNEFGNLTSQTDGKGQTTTWTYDGIHRPLTEDSDTTPYVDIEYLYDQGENTKGKVKQIHKKVSVIESLLNLISPSAKALSLSQCAPPGRNYSPSRFLRSGTPYNIDEGQPLEITPTWMEDPYASCFGAVFTLTVGQLPPNAWFDGRKLHWIPDHSQSGTHQATFTLDDGLGNNTTVTENIQVNDAPETDQVLTRYDYDLLGRITVEHKMISGMWYTTNYQLDNQNQIIVTTYSNGKQLVRELNEAGQINRLIYDSQPVAGNITYGPNGSLTEITYANGQKTTRTYDPQKMLRLTALTTEAIPNFTSVNYTGQELIYDLSVDKGQNFSVDLTPQTNIGQTIGVVRLSSEEKAQRDLGKTINRLTKDYDRQLKRVETYQKRADKWPKKIESYTEKREKKMERIVSYEKKIKSLSESVSRNEGAKKSDEKRIKSYERAIESYKKITERYEATILKYKDHLESNLQKLREEQQKLSDIKQELDSLLNPEVKEPLQDENPPQNSRDPKTGGLIYGSSIYQPNEEILQLRTATSRHTFIKFNHENQPIINAQIMSAPSAYRNTKGEWVAIHPQWKNQTDRFVVEGAEYILDVPLQVINQSGMRFGSSSAPIRIIPREMQSGSFNQPFTTSRAVQEEYRINYPDALTSSIDLELKLLSDGFIKNIILKDNTLLRSAQSDELQFNFELSVPDGTVFLQEGQEWNQQDSLLIDVPIIIQPPEGKGIKIEPPQASNADGMNIPVQMQLQKEGSSIILQKTLSLTHLWIAEYPVKFDATFTYMAQGSGENGYIKGDGSCRNGCNYAFTPFETEELKVGVEGSTPYISGPISQQAYRSFMSFDTSQLLSSFLITDAKVNLRSLSWGNRSADAFGVSILHSPYSQGILNGYNFEALSAVHPGGLWFHSPTSDNHSIPLSDIVRSTIVVGGQTVFALAQRYDIDPISNPPCVRYFTAYSCAEWRSMATYASARHPNPAYHPTFSVTYTAPNITPDLATSLQVEGLANPPEVLDLTPEFSAIFNDQNVGEITNAYHIQVNTQADFLGTTMWDTAAQGMQEAGVGERAINRSYAGTPLTQNGQTYYWRVKFRDSSWEWSPWSTESSTFTMYNDLPNQAPFAPTNLKVDGQSNPIGLTNLLPTFAAEFRDINGIRERSQSVQVQVIKSGGTFTTPFWDSGTVALSPLVRVGAANPPLTYSGPTLIDSAQRYFYRMRFTDDESTIGEWSSGTDFFERVDYSQLQNITYEFDAVGNITRILNQVNHSGLRDVHYTYDDLDRLKTANAIGLNNITLYNHTYAYTPTGNFDNKSGAQYTYSQPGKTNPQAVTNLNQQAYYTYDDNGSMITQGSDQYVWDYKNRMTTSVKNGRTTTYQYDHTMNRVSKSSQQPRSGGLEAVTTHYITPEYEVEYDSAHPGGQLTRTNIYLGQLLIAVVETDGQGQTDTYYHHQDHLGGGSVVTGQNGQLVEVTEYYPFGWIQIDQSYNGHYAKLKFTGKEKDNESYLSYYEARYYNSDRGRFTGADPASRFTPQQFLQDPQQLNLYSYTRNNPVRYTDPTGLCAWDLCVGEAATLTAMVTFAGAALMSWYLPNSDQELNNLVQSGALVIGASSTSTVSKSYQDAIIRASAGSAAGTTASSVSGMSGGQMDPDDWEKLNRNQKEKVTKIQRDIYDLQHRKTLSGDKNFWDSGHLTKVKNYVNAFKNSISSIRGSLENPNLSVGARRALTSSLRAAKHTLKKAQDIAKQMKEYIGN